MKTIKDKKRLSRYLAETAYTDLFPEAMNEIAVLKSFDPGETLIRQGEEPDSFLFLVKGRCSVTCLLPNGKTILLKTVTSPSMLGEMELISPERSPLTVRTLEECELIVFPMKQSRRILLSSNAFLRKLCILLGTKERDSVIRFFTSAGYPLDRRLAAFILEQREGRQFRIRKIQASQTLGVSYRHLETVLSRFVKEGILTKERFTYTINNETALQELASEMTSVL